MLKDVARRSIEHGVRTGHPLRVDPAAYPTELRYPRATFVTVRREGALRGCIGTLEADEPLVVSVAENAFKAAFRDPRFPPLRDLEIPGLEIHISVLGPLERVDVASEDDLVSLLRPHVDGVLLREGSYQGTFLPAVWDSLPAAPQFVRELKRKAGLPADYWSNALEIWRFTSESAS
jgi:AmmeMemoRadiSam system protein A